MNQDDRLTDIRAILRMLTFCQEEAARIKFPHLAYFVLLARLEAEKLVAGRPGEEMIADQAAAPAWLM